MRTRTLPRTVTGDELDEWEEERTELRNALRDLLAAVYDEEAGTVGSPRMADVMRAREVLNERTPDMQEENEKP